LEKVAKNSKRELKFKAKISKKILNSTSALCCKRILTVLACPLKAARQSGVPVTDTASTSVPLERRNFTISQCPEERNK
jgi:hypothetical protein